MFASLMAYDVAACKDGTSNTVAFSEKLIGDNTEGANNGAESFYAVSWPTGGYGQGKDDQVGPAPRATWLPTSPRATTARAADRNQKNDMSSMLGGRAGRSWGRCSRCSDANSPNADCVAHPAPNGMITARSRHPGGVNALMADGSVRFVKNGISQATWWAIGTRRLGEVVSSNSY